MSDIESFYDDLADYYHLIYPDWEASVRRQAEQLDAVIRERLSADTITILDAACGIGTQAIGLASLGHEVSGSDISEFALTRAKEFAANRGIDIVTRRADMREVDQVFEEPFDLVIACDNSVPHLQTDEEILSAFQAFHRATLPDAAVLISVRDYSKMHLEDLQLRPRLVHDRGEGLIVLCDVWEVDGDHYSITIYAIEDRGRGSPKVTAIRGGRYYCVTIERLKDLFLQAGYVEVEVLHQAYFQPVIFARKGSAGA